MGPPPEPPGDGPALDIRRVIDALDRHGAEYVVVGGAAAISYGARRATTDVDCVARHDTDNLERVAAAMRELGARLDVEGLSDEEAKQLPVQLDARALAGMEISTWMTDAGGLDILADIPDRDGRRMTYDALLANAERIDNHGLTVRVAGLEDIIASKEWANRPKDHQALDELRAIRDARAAADLAQTCFPKPARGTQPPAPDHGRPGAQPGRDTDLER